VHIPDGYLGPAASAALYGAMLPAWAVAGRRVRADLRTRDVPAMALGGAFSFVVMFFQVPWPGGTSGHAVGAALAAIALGPAAAIIAVTVALTIQAFLYGDGGILALGANCFNMALVMPLSGYAVFQAVAAGSPSPARRALAAGLAGYVALNLGALATAIELGLQGALEPGVYCPYGLEATIPGLLVPHLLLFGFLEAAVTAGVVAFLARGEAGGRELAAMGEKRRALWIGLGALCLASPIGLLAAGTAWGEWAPGELKARLGYTPPGLARLTDIWRAAIPDYEVPGLGKGAGTVVSAVLGVAVVAALAAGLGRALVRRRDPREERGHAPELARK
jgi:cobalt/nickel transport system permease protein